MSRRAVLPSLPQLPQFPTGDQFAISLAAGRDLNGDRVPDLVIGDASRLEGVDMWFVSGRDGSVLARREYGDGPSGVSVDMVGDIDRDGCTEVAVSVHIHTLPGYAEILSGRERTTLRTIRSQELGLRIHHVRGAGSVDEDGSPDLLVVGSQAIDASTRQASLVVVSGSKGSVVWRVSGPSGRGHVSAGAAAVGDVDADDRDDVVVRWVHEDSSSTPVVLFSGGTGLPLRSFVGHESERDFGYSLDGGVDFDGDLRPDILVGSPDPYTRSAALGRVHVFSGRDGALSCMLDGSGFPRRDAADSDEFGECARFVRDTDGDGVPELLVGSPEEGLFEGSAYLCSGRTGSILHAIEGHCMRPRRGEPDLGDHHVGRLLADAGDLDRDGVEDFVVASVPYDRGQCGRVRVFSGRTGATLLDLDRPTLVGRSP